MKKIGKYTLSALAKSMSQCDREEMSKFIGGGFKYTFNGAGQLDKVEEVEEVEGDMNIVSAGGSILSVSGDLSINFTPANEDFKSGGLSINGGNMDLFKFLADNTDVEWAASYDSNGNAVINTNYDAYAVEVNRLDGFEYHIHSHPGEIEENEAYSYASDKDVSSGVASLRGTLHGKYDYERFEIYIPATENSEGEIFDYTNYVKQNLPDRDKKK